MQIHIAGDLVRPGHEPPIFALNVDRTRMAVIWISRVSFPAFGAKKFLACSTRSTSLSTEVFFVLPRLPRLESSGSVHVERVIFSVVHGKVNLGCLRHDIFVHHRNQVQGAHTTPQRQLLGYLLSGS